MECKKINANDIADITLLYCFENGLSISPLKLQKILYYIQSWYMVYFDKELLFEEKPQAWVNGPVYPTIYHRFQNIGIYDPMNPNNVKIRGTLQDKIKELGLGKDKCDFLDSIYCHYGSMSHDKLVFLTHAEDPWSEQREGLNPFEPSQKELSLDTMYIYYKTRLDKNRAKNI